MSGVAMRRSARRLLVPLAVLVASLLVATEPVAASVSYSSVLKLARSQAFPTTTSAIARSSSPTSSRLHVVYTSKNIDGVDDQDTGPYQGIYYRRSSTGSSWTTPKRLNSSSQHADYGSVATAGTRVYVVWRTQTHIEDYENPADPYLIRFRANDNQGSSTAWRSSIALTTFGRADRPMIAATGSSVYVTYTDRGTGEIELLKSTDYGKTWGSPTAVGATVDLPGGEVLWGYHGYPVVAVTGSTVAIAYTSDDQIVSRVSTNGGTSFEAPDMRSATDASISITARSGRIGLAYTDFTRRVCPGADVLRLAAVAQGGQLPELEVQPAVQLRDRRVDRPARCRAVLDGGHRARVLLVHHALLQRGPGKPALAPVREQRVELGHRRLDRVRHRHDATRDELHAIGGDGRLGHAARAVERPVGGHGQRVGAVLPDAHRDTLIRAA